MAQCLSKQGAPGKVKTNFASLRLCAKGVPQSKHRICNTLYALWKLADEPFLQKLLSFRMISFEKRWIIVLLCWPGLLVAQPTVGLLHYQSEVMDGYTLLAPLQSATTYLIDNCGRQVHTWPGTGWTGNAVYLLADGSLMRTERISGSTYNTGGKGGRLLHLDWEGNLLWSYTYANELVHQHHDIEILPNGNILLLAWEKKTAAEAIAAGRDPATTPPEIWSEQIVELQPIGTDSANIVWEWHLWDHLIQDFDPDMANYGVISEHPGRINLNYIGLVGAGGADWIHLNSIDYHPQRDQLVLCSRAFSEIWILDHSTTSQEAAGQTGGLSGKGGNLLYRWGNPQAYQRGTEEDQVLFTAHDAHWLHSGESYSDTLLFFNNGVGRPEGTYSTVEELALPLDGQGNYLLEDPEPFGPEQPSWIYTAETPEDFFSKILSGAQRLPNGNTLICEGMFGRIFEITPTEEVVWEYLNPVNQFGPVAQGQEAPQNHVFRAYRFAPDFPAFTGRDLTPGEPIELMPWDTPCALAAQTTLAPSRWRMQPNPFQDQLIIKQLPNDHGLLQLLDSSGKVWLEQIATASTVILNTQHLPDGWYLLTWEGQVLDKVVKLP